MASEGKGSPMDPGREKEAINAGKSISAIGLDPEFFQKFESDDEVYLYYQRIGENLLLRGEQLRSFVTDHVKEYKDMWKKHLEHKRFLDHTEKQKQLQELKNAEREMDTSLQKAQIDMEEKRRTYEKELENSKLKHEKEMKKLELEFESKRLVEQKKQRKFEETQRKKQRQHEKAQIKAELLDKQKQREHEFMMQQQELTANQKKMEEEVRLRNEKKDLLERKNLPKMSIFKPDLDDIDAFINRFELMARSLQWDKDSWGLYLASYLEGEALSLFNYLIQDGYIDYNTLKAELLFKFKCDSEGFHERFRNGVPAADESFNAYYTRLAGLFNRWLSLKNVQRDFNSLFDFMIVEQMLAGCCKELRVHLKERRLVKSSDIIEEANSYREARANKDVAKKGPVTLSGSSQMSAAATLQPNSNTGLQNPRGSNNQRGTGRGFRGRGAGQNGGYQNQGESQLQAKKTCTFCKKDGHLQQDCWTYQRQILSQNQQGSSATPLVLGAACSANVPTASGKVNGKSALIMRDTGASIAGVRKSFVQHNQFLPHKTTVQLFDGSLKDFQTAKVFVESPFFTGEVVCCVIESPPFDFILGNIDGTKTGDLILANTALGCVTTRSQNKEENRKNKPLKVTETAAAELGISREKLIELQRKDTSLEKYRLAAGSNKKLDNGSHQYIFQNDILCRIYRERNKDPVTQILVPDSLRHPLLSMAHECLLAGHGGRRRTTERLYTNFFWPKIHDDVKNFCRSCDRCQKTAPKVPPLPLEFMPCITEPFSRIAIDITGPFSPPSEDGHRFILSVIDIGTRFPLAIPLKKIDTQTVAEEIIKICTLMGFPKEVLSDNAGQFTSEMMYEVYRLMNINAVHSSPYHAQSNGVVERFHGTIKPMIRKLVDKQPKNWHRVLPALLFACRDVPNKSTGFSPFELLFGRRPRGPLDLIADHWTEKADQAEKSVFQYICDLKEFFKEAAVLVEENVETAARSNKKYKDRGARSRKFKVNDEVLLLLPDTCNKLLMGWKGPYRVTECRNNDYVLDIEGKAKLYHANLLKKYYRRQEQQLVQEQPHVNKSKELPSLAIPNSEIVGDDFNPREAIICIASVFVPDPDEEMTVTTLPSSQETIDDAKLDNKLTEEMEMEMRTVLGFSQTLYSKEPGTFIGPLQHTIPVTTQHPVRRKQYPLPFSSQEILKKEVDYMESIGVIERSNSPYCSPVVLVGKPDGDTRVCLDYRELNKVTIFDAEPIPDIEELFIKLAKKKFFTKVDLSKGFWQIKIRPEDRPKTAFQAPQGLYQFTRMPFGLVTAPATFARMMRLLDLEKCSSMNFFDDILTASETWEQHLLDVQKMLKCLEQHGLTVRPSKIFAGFQELEFLGHMVGGGTIRPEHSKVEKILSVPKPNTKKQIRSLMGLLGYYRRYIPAYSVITAPITDQLKGNKKTIEWNADCEEALSQVQRLLSQKPILILPDLTKSFTVQTDASNIGIAGVILQDLGGKMHPVAYVSRKLLDRETRYSTIEKECLAIVWTLKKLDRYLWGQKFTLQTDHKPLTFLTSAVFKNNRILGWSLAMQGYSFNVKEIAGKDNILADILSRSGSDQSLP